MKRSFLTDRSGQTLVVGAVFIGLVALGFLAIAVDVGTLFRQKRMAQGAADAAAVAAAEEVSANNASAKQSIANTIAKLNGFDTTLAVHPASVVLSTPTTGNFTGTGYIQASVSRAISTPFLATFNRGSTSITVSATAIAGAAATPTCVCIANKTSSDIVMSNGSKIEAAGCGIVDNSSAGNALQLAGGATINGLTFGIVSTTWNNNGNINNGGNITPSTTVVQGISSTCSPTLPAAPAYSGCTGDPGGTSTSFTAGPANASSVICYNSLTVGANGTADTLKPGIYVINGGSLRFEAGTAGKSNLGGQGVFFYLTGNASLTIDNGANVNLVSGGSPQNGGGTAPTVGVYNGILFYQASADTQPISVQGGATLYMYGAIYAPSAAVTLANGSGSNLTGGIVANTLNMSGGGTLNATADISAGGLSTTAAKLVQ
jgi:Flp pilus assembly protein TadG